MYKISVAFFILLFSMTTFVAAAPSGTRQPVYIAPFRKQADGNQKQPVYMVPFRKRAAGTGNKNLQKKKLASLRATAEASIDRTEAAEAKSKQLETGQIHKEQEIASLKHTLYILDDMKHT